MQLSDVWKEATELSHQSALLAEDFEFVKARHHTPQQVSAAADLVINLVIRKVVTHMRMVRVQLDNEGTDFKMELRTRPVVRLQDIETILRDVKVLEGKLRMGTTS